MSNANAPSTTRVTGTRGRRRNTLLRAALLAGLAGAAGAALADTPAASGDGPLTWNGITLYGILDVGFQHETHGAAESDWHPAGTNSIIQKNSQGPIDVINGNNLSQSRLGLKGSENLGGGWSGIFRLETFFNPWSGEISDGLKSVTSNNGVALKLQQVGVDSSIAGQTFGGAAFLGVSHADYGTLTFGRQNSTMADGIGKYDPMGASQAFSVLGFSGGPAGGGDTENRRFDNSLKYEATIGSAHFGGQFQNRSGANPGTSSAFVLGFSFPGGSIDGYYLKKNDAIAANSLSAAQVTSIGHVCAGTGSAAEVAAYACAPIDKAVTATISDNTAYAIMGKWSFADKKATLSAGYENIKFTNPSSPLYPGQMTIGGYILANVNNAGFPLDKTLKVGWIGLKWALDGQTDVTVAYYRYDQNSYSTAHPGCSDAAISGQCSGGENFISAVYDHRFSKRFDLYAGAMYTSVSGGLANGYLNTSNIDPTIGFRFQW